MFGRGKGNVEGFQFGPIHIIRVGRNKWRFVQFGPDPNKPGSERQDPRGWDTKVDEGELHGPPESISQWGKQRWKAFEFLYKLQRALEDKKITPVEYYKILSKQQHDAGRCKEPHTHSAKCDYHPYHPD